ncbi:MULTISPECIES: hypothetical protein [unclassified Coleofasciculus]|uniref:hypothetical protein n=1 Tax=unclassified Coleofasciculus TaxID=2692782 RepID=UPI001881DBE5|nr:MULTISPECIES: hypothetical protein [unclassified Coleofasciculus]MBE9126606.1 hypothetical protein [Coleofasciculus sp. LEGE 07081]MBE9148858.1 hypothetical protein [Coleofasciculus sp. LEGE 07092]
MKLPYFLKNLPTPARILLRPMLLISLVLHGAVLMLPLAYDLKKSENPEKEKTVKITKLSSPTQSSSKAFPKSSLSPKSTPRRTRRRQDTPLQTPQWNQTSPPQIIITRSLEQTNPSQNQQISQPSATSNASQAQPQQNGETSNDSNEESTLPQKVVNFFATFPRYPRAEKGSGGVLRSEFDEATYIWHTADNLETVAENFENELLPTKNFDSPKRIKGEPNFRVYEVSSHTDETNYLHLISKDEITAIYLESEEYSLEQLMEADTEDRSVMAGLSIAIEMVKNEYRLKDFEENDLNRLVEKDNFKGKNFEFKFARKTTAEQPASPTELASSLNKQLKGLGFESLSEEGNYGGGTIYKVKQSEFEIYLIFAPAHDQDDNPITVIIPSKEKPR